MQCIKLRFWNLNGLNYDELEIFIVNTEMI